MNVSGSVPISVAKGERIMAKRASKDDFAKLRAILQREMAAGATHDEAFAAAYKEDPERYNRIAGSKPRAK